MAFLLQGEQDMHANEAPTHTADSTCEGDRQLPPPSADPPDVDEAMELDDEDVSEEAGYGYGV